MTDDELREAGKGFIAMRCETIASTPHLSDDEKLDQIRLWDYVDPIRLAVYVSAKSEAGAFVVDMDRIRAVCLNPGGFAKRPPKGSLRIGLLNEWTAAPKIELPKPVSIDWDYAEWAAWVEGNGPTHG